MAVASAPRNPLTIAYDDFLRTFSNVLFAVSLFVVWGVLTILGVIIPQGKDAPFYFDMYAPALARLVLRSGMDNVYHSAAYVGIIGMILLSLTVCTFKRVIPARLPALRPVRVEHIPLHAFLEVSAPLERARQCVAQFFQSRGFLIRKREFGGEEWTFADRHDWARRGVLIAHIGFVIIAAGTTIYWAFGFSGQTAVMVGQTAAIDRANASVTLQNFNYSIKPIQTKSGIVYQPVDYVSDVLVRTGDGSVRRQTVRVNHPIDLGGTLLYQAAYGFGVQLKVTQYAKAVSSLRTRTLQEGDGFTLPGSTRSVQYAQFVPTLDRTTGNPTADPRVNNPAVALNVFDGDQALGSVLTPIGKSVSLGGGYAVTPVRYVLYSGFDYRHDPGIPLVGIGAFVLLAGLCISFYLLPARIFVRMTAQEGGTQIGLAATTVKGYDIFENEFRALSTQLEESCA